MNDIDIQRIVRALRKIFPQDTRNTMVQGEVTKLDPLEIDIGTMTLTEEFLVLGQNCRPHKVTIPHTHIVDTHFTEMSPSIGSVGTGLVAGTAFENAQKAAAESKMNKYTTLKDDGNEEQKQISDKDLGRGKVETSIIVAGQATVTDDSVMITDNGHKHILSRQITKDVHFPKSDYEESVTIEIEPKLAVGDTVLMFAFNNFQKWYVAERVYTADEK